MSLIFHLNFLVSLVVPVLSQIVPYKILRNYNQSKARSIDLLIKTCISTPLNSIRAHDTFTDPLFNPYHIPDSIYFRKFMFTSKVNTHIYKCSALQYSHQLITIYRQVKNEFTMLALRQNCNLTFNFSIKQITFNFYSYLVPSLLYKTLNHN